VAYYLAGKLALMLAIPPGYATAVWPSSGIALAGLLLLGWRAWPGVLLGSFLVNAGTAVNASATTSLVTSLTVAGSIAAGAALQAVAGAALVRRFIGFPLALDDDREVSRFLLLGAVGCLVSPTAGVGTLLLSGLVSAEALAFSWWTWWVGDTIGVVIFAPLILIWTATPREAWHRRRLSVTGPLTVLSILLVVLFVRTSAWEQERIQRQFDERAGNMIREVERTLREHLDVLESVQDFAASVPGFDRQAFQNFAAGALARRPGMYGLSWNLRVPDSQRAAVEASARRDGHPTFRIREQNAQGELVPAGRRDEYAVVYYLEPQTGNRTALGLDAASEPARARALALARDLDQPVASAVIRLVQTGDQGFVIVRPVFASGLPHGTVEERRRNLRGYATAVVRIADLVETPVRELEHDGIQLRLYDQTPPQADRLLYVYPRSAGARPEPAQRPQLGVTSTFEIAGRRWTVRASAGPSYLALHRAWAAWAVLAGGLLFTSLLGAFLLVITGRASKIELQVAQRTADLAESNQTLRQLASIVESSSDAIIGMTLDGVIRSWNGGAERTYGYTLAEVRDRHVSLLHPGGTDEVRRSDIFDRVRAGDRITDLETVNLTKDGRLIEVSLTVSAIHDAAGRVIGASTIARDITDRKALDRMKEDFVGTVSHELRTPLSAIKGFVELVADGEAGPVSDTQQEFLEIVVRNADRLTGLINDLLDVSCLASEGLELRADSLDLGEVLAEVAATFRQAAESKGLEFQAPAVSVPWVVGDRERLIQVFGNLISNAVKYTPQGAVGFRAAQCEDGVEVVVYDTGIGLSLEEQSRLFTKFFRGSSRVAREVGGTGLGLVIAKAIVERHRGWIEVESTPGQGTRFRVVLPRGSSHSTGRSAA
jgi:PAS domain S-box-containing protein